MLPSCIAGSLQLDAAPSGAYHCLFLFCTFPTAGRRGPHDGAPLGLWGVPQKLGEGKGM